MFYICTNENETKMELLYITFSGLGVMQSLLLLLLSLDDKTKREAWVQNQIEKYMDRLKKDVKDQKEVREMVSWIVDDKFDTETISSAKNRNLLNKLQDLKDAFITFYFMHLEEMPTTNSQIKRTCDVHTTIGEYVLQIMRLRLVIQPEYQIAMNKHTQTHHEYMAVKAFWINDDGEKVRKFTKSLGRAENYKLGIKDKQAQKDSVALLQPVIFKSYLQAYPE